MKQTIFTGMATAMVTPMTPEGVDYEALGRFIDFQLSQGINALVAVGTTGESATLSPAERKEVIRFTIDRVAGRVPVIAGTGTNNTQHAMDYSISAARDGADALLVVTPYYNKATQNGLIAHFTAIADKVDKPIILYNVPSRTGCNLLPATVEKLAEHPNIAAIKEASGNMSQVVELFARCGDKLDVYSGEDGLTVPILSMGGKGTISVLSNVVPKEAVAMTNAFFAGDVAEAARLQCRYLNLINLLFCEVNPIPAKAAVSAMGFGKEYIRLPLTPMEEGNRAKLLAEMRRLGVQV
ncbi:MAG: 4-hydroxy-tetrahydrodipicolinate synthase [Candidatus Faecousia sp.]|nr:4-hydroxy-tetrahydrodipicolinate synthase [Oscillospiraceae bacterium]MDD6855690.1 4-hydroxy-tetrahydrodipicolinate synthase [Oscillospiraceae bacterium]MDY2557882.1 4-hydroxy-tetrahydrodipicolinate synthase [Candidatus Faecousia sp.]